jgi:hypothetical protein
MAHLDYVPFRVQKTGDSALVLAGDLNRSFITLHLAKLLELCHGVPLLLGTGISVPAIKAKVTSGLEFPIFVAKHVHMSCSCHEIVQS